MELDRDWYIAKVVEGSGFVLRYEMCCDIHRV
jgi:hypothetical protein